MTKKQPQEQRVGEILDAAVCEFVEKGYEGASMDAIATRARLTKGGLYHHFRSKDEILLAANFLFTEPIVRLQEAAQKASSPLEGLRRYMRAYLKHWAAHERETVFTFLSLTKAVTSHDLRPPYEHYYEGMIRFFEGLLLRAVEEGSLVPHDARARAIAIMSALDGALGYLLVSHKQTSARLSRMLDDVFLGPIRAGAERGES